MERIAQVFDFQYTLECYVPKSKRVRGYFCLPILWGTQFVGQLDAKVDRKTATLHLRHLLFENTINADQLAELVPFLAKKIRAFAAFNQCQQLVIEQISPMKYRDFISKNLL